MLLSAFSNSSAPSNTSNTDRNGPQKAFRIGITTWPPYVSNCPEVYPTLYPSDACPLPGIDAEVLGLMMEFMQQPYELVTMNSTDIGLMFNMVEKGSLDTISFGVQRTPARQLIFDFTYPTLQMSPVFIARSRKKTYFEQAASMFTSFDSTLWMIILSFFLAQIISFIFVNRVLKKTIRARSTKKAWNPAKIIWNSIRYFIQQAEEDMRQKTYSGNVLLVVFALQSVFVVSLYEGSLLSQLMLPPKLAPFRTADEMIALIKKGSYRMVTAHPDHWYLEELKNSERSHFKSLREATLHNPVVIVDSVQKALNLVMTGNYIQVEDNDGDGYLAAKAYDGLSFVFEGIPPEYRHYLVQIGSPWKPLLDQAALMAQERSEQVWNKYLAAEIGRNDTSTSDSNANASTDVKSLNFAELFGVFFLLLVGAIIGVVSFISEILLSSQERKTKKLKLLAPNKNWLMTPRVKTVADTVRMRSYN